MAHQVPQFSTPFSLRDAMLIIATLQDRRLRAQEKALRQERIEFQRINAAKVLEAQTMMGGNMARVGDRNVDLTKVPAGEVVPLTPEERVQAQSLQTTAGLGGEPPTHGQRAGGGVFIPRPGKIAAEMAELEREAAKEVRAGEKHVVAMEEAETRQELSKLELAKAKREQAMGIEFPTIAGRVTSIARERENVMLKGTISSEGMKALQESQNPLGIVLADLANKTGGGIKPEDRERVYQGLREVFEEEAYSGGHKGHFMQIIRELLEDIEGAKSDPTTHPPKRALQAYERLKAGWARRFGAHVALPHQDRLEARIQPLRARGAPE